MKDNQKDIDKKSNNHQTERKNLARNTLFTYIIRGTFVLSIFKQFLLARILPITLWGYLILTISIITIISIASYFLPPAVDYSISFYGSKYLAEEKQAKLRNFLGKTLLIKLALIIPLFIASIILFYAHSDFFTLILSDNLYILYILSPLIICNAFTLILNAIHRIFNKYKTILLLTVAKNAIYISALLIIVFLNTSPRVNLHFISLFLVLSYILPFLANFAIVFHRIQSLKKTPKTKPKAKANVKEESELTLKQVASKITNYGIFISSKYITTTLWKEIQIQGVGAFSANQNVTGYNISYNYAKISDEFFQGIMFPLMNSLTQLKVNDSPQNLESMFKTVLKYILFFNCLLIGLLLFTGDYFLLIIYGENFLIFAPFITLILIAFSFRILLVPLRSLLYANGQVKSVFILRLLTFGLDLTFFLTGIIFFNVIIAIWGIIFSNVLILVIYVIHNLNYTDIHLDIKTTILQYILFYTSLVVVYVIRAILLKYFVGTGLSIVIFFIMYLTLNLLLKIFSKSDLRKIKALFSKDKFIQEKIRKLIDILLKS